MGIYILPDISWLVFKMFLGKKLEEASDGPTLLNFIGKRGKEQIYLQTNRVCH
jgi:hypothetical protein